MYNQINLDFIIILRKKEKFMRFKKSIAVALSAVMASSIAISSASAAVTDEVMSGA